MTCLCKLADAGKPRGSPEWFQNGDGLSVETLNIPRRSPNQPAESLVCAGVSAIGQESPGTTFSPKYAFLRPGTINYTTTYESRSEESCCGNAGVFATCEITATEVNPAPRIVFLVDDIEIPSQQDDADEKYRSTARFRPEVGGIFRLECQIKNAIFPDLVEGSEANVTIHSPVQFAQSSKVIERYSIKIDPDSPVTINADITAYPRATNFTLYKGTLEQNITVDDYGVKYIELSPSAGTVELTMRINSSLDLTTYALLIENGIGDGLVYSFILEEDEDDLTLVYIIVGVIAGVLVIAAIVVALVCCWVRRRKQSLSPLSEKDTDEGKSKQDPADEENIYNVPEEDEVGKGDGQVDYVNNDVIPPNFMAPKPPKTKGAMIKVEKKGEKKQNEDANPKQGSDGDKPKPKPKPKRKELNNGGTKSATPTSGYYNIKDEDTNSDVPPGPDQQIYVNMPRGGVGVESDEAGDDKGVQDTDDADPSRSVSGSAVEDSYYSSINEGVLESDRVMY